MSSHNCLNQHSCRFPFFLNFNWSCIFAWVYFHLYFSSCEFVPFLIRVIIFSLSCKSYRFKMLTFFPMRQMVVFFKKIFLSLNLIHDLWSYIPSLNCFVLKWVSIFLLIYLLNKTTSRCRSTHPCMYFMNTHSFDLRHNPTKWVLCVCPPSPRPLPLPPHYFKMRKPGGEKEVPYLD